MKGNFEETTERCLRVASAAVAASCLAAVLHAAPDVVVRVVGNPWILPVCACWFALVVGFHFANLLLKRW